MKTGFQSLSSLWTNYSEIDCKVLYGCKYIMYKHNYDVYGNHTIIVANHTDNCYCYTEETLAYTIYNSMDFTWLRFRR